MPCLSACAPLLAVLGSGHSAVAIVAQIERVKLVGDGISYVASSKTLNDHALSKIVNADCRMLNVLSRERVCAATVVAAQAPAALAAVDEAPPQPAVHAEPAIEPVDTAQTNVQASGD